jgi:PTS system cellobiose-specific IIA component
MHYKFLKYSQGVDKMDEEQLIFTIIANSGEAKSSAMEAINYAKKRQFEEADNAIKTAYDSFVKIHQVQTEMIVKEVNGEKQPMSLLMVHAQDHLMTTMLFIDLAKEFIEVVQKGMALSKTGALNNKDVKLFEPKQEETIVESDVEEDITLDEPQEEVIDVEHNKQLKQKVAGKYKTATVEQKAQVKEILGKYGAAKLDETKPTQMFEDILAIL